MKLSPLLSEHPQQLTMLLSLCFYLALLVYFLADPAQFINHSLDTWIIDFFYAFLAIVAAPFIARSRRVKKALTSRPDRNAQVYMRAEVEFYQAGLNQTQGQTGIMIFVSMLEHQVVILADKAISNKLPDSTWKGVVDLVTTGIKEKSLQQGICAGIKKCGDILEEHFPIAPDDVNEVKDHLIIIDQ